MNVMSKDAYRAELARGLTEILKLNIDIEMRKNAANCAIYKWTEADGKYENNRYWSLRALEYYNRKGNRAYKLVHEHIVPRRIIKSELMNLTLYDLNFIKNNDIKTTKVYEILNKYCIGAVITKAEDLSMNAVMSNSKSLKSAMPLEYEDNTNTKYYKNVWARYVKTNEVNSSDYSKTITILDLNNHGAIIDIGIKGHSEAVHKELTSLVENNKKKLPFEDVACMVVNGEFFTECIE